MINVLILGYVAFILLNYDLCYNMTLLCSINRAWQKSYKFKETLLWLLSLELL